MKVSALFVHCLVCFCHAWRPQKSAECLECSPSGLATASLGTQKTPGSLKVLASLFSVLSPGAGFTPPRSGADAFLASSCRSPFFPTAVLIHGIDDSRHSFRGTAARLLRDGYPCLTLDLRGHGESPLGDPNSFSASALGADVLAALRSHGVDRAVLVGHSMGARVAMRAAAIDASNEKPLLASVIIEDMDLRPRVRPDPVKERRMAIDQIALECYGGPDGRRFSSWEEAREELLPWYGGNQEVVDRWRGNLVRQLADGTWWSDISPAAQRLANELVLSSLDGSDAWDELGAHGDDLPFAVHVWYADGRNSPEDSEVELSGEGGLEDMQRRLPAARLRFFPGAKHSIHNTVPEAFDEALREIINDAARRLSS